MKLNTEKTVAVSTTVYWQNMDTCPTGVKTQLLSAGGIAMYGTYRTRRHVLHWLVASSRTEAGMSELQKEAVTAAGLGGRYQKIKAVFDLLPDRFRLLDLLQKAGIKDGLPVRGAVGLILYRDFRCINVGTGLNRVWKKPS